MTMKPVNIIPQLELPFRDHNVVDRIVGIKRKRVDEGPIDFSECQLRKAYPTYDDFLEAVGADRRSALAEGRLPHPATRPPPRPKRPSPPREAPPWEDGPTVSDVRRAYGTKFKE